jgi:maleylacetoacetate isomerase
VRAFCALKGIEYESHIVNLLKKEQSSEEYKEKNPSGYVPCWVEDDFVLSQSVAIMEYLEDIHPEKPLLPANPRDRATVRMLVQQMNSGIQPLQNLAVITHVKELLGSDEAKMAWAKKWLDEGLLALEHMLEKCSGKYCFGDTITMADCVLIPQIYTARRFKVDISAFPKISAILEALSEVKELDAAAAENQPDAVAC